MTTLQANSAGVIIKNRFITGKTREVSGRMCGIAGFCNFNTDKSSRERVMRLMTDCMRERGPDAEGLELLSYRRPDGGEADMTLGHRRLAIMDLSPAGVQPMTSHSGRLAVVYNGEIYNHRDIKRELESAGAVKPSDWRGTSDTEILLEAVEAWGIEEAVKRFKGMFAIAVFDKETGRLSLVRDRVGEKPLYYGFVGETFVFASDIRCFTKLPGFNNGINRAVLPLYFVHGYIPAPYSIYNDVWKLEPGTILTVDAPFARFDPKKELDEMERRGLSSKAADRGGFSAGDTAGSGGHLYTVYWSMWEAMQNGAFHGGWNIELDYDKAVDELERLLTDSIRRQMIADVPLGAFLSAGIDSSTIVALMQKIAKEDGAPPVRTFTIGMSEEGFNEAEVAKLIAKHLGTVHTDKYITKEDALSVIPKLPEMFGEPFADSSQIPTYLVSQMTREHVTVSLSGDAGDELFCGYTSYESIYRIWGKLRMLSPTIRRPASGLLSRLPGIQRSETRRLQARLLAAKSPVDLHRLESDYDPIIQRIALPAGEALPYKLTQITDKCFWRAYEGSDEWGRALRETMFSDLVLYHPDDILVKVDRCAMANSLETRVPFLDQDVVEFAWTLPTEWLLDNGVRKKILKEVLYRHVPKELMDRPKKGFGIPIERWLLEEPLRSWAEELLSAERIKKEGYLDPDAVSRLWTDYTERGVWRVQIWYALMFEEFIKNRG